MICVVPAQQFDKEHTVLVLKVVGEFGGEKIERLYLRDEYPFSREVAALQHEVRGWTFRQLNHAWVDWVHNWESDVTRHGRVWKVGSFAEGAFALLVPFVKVPGEPSTYVVTENYPAIKVHTRELAVGTTILTKFVNDLSHAARTRASISNLV